jgi:hypothetical protein
MDGYFPLFVELIRRDDWDNQYAEILYEHEILHIYHRAYHILNEAGAVYCQGGTMWNGEPILNVNENYLKKHPITDLEGNLVDLNRIDSDRIILVPEMYYGRGVITQFIGQGYEAVFIDDEQVIFDYSIDWSFHGKPAQPYLIAVLKDTAFRLEASPLDYVFIDGDINELLRGTHFHNKIIVTTVGDELSRIRDWHSREAREHIMVMVPTFALVLVIIAQYAFLFSKVFRKRIYARKIMGHGQLRIYSQLLLESSLAVFAAISIVWYLQLDIRLFMVVLILEVAVYLAAVAISQWKRSTVYDYYTT